MHVSPLLLFRPILSMVHHLHVSCFNISGFMRCTFADDENCFMRSILIPFESDLVVSRYCLGMRSPIASAHPPQDNAGQKSICIIDMGHSTICFTFNLFIKMSTNAPMTSTFAMLERFVLTRLAATRAHATTVCKEMEGHALVSLSRT